MYVNSGLTCSFDRSPMALDIVSFDRDPVDHAIPGTHEILDYLVIVASQMEFDSHLLHQCQIVYRGILDDTIPDRVVYTVTDTSHDRRKRN